MRASVLVQLLILSAALNLGWAQSPEKPPVPGAKRVAISAPRPEVPAEARAKHLKGSGVCIVYVRPDGTVSRVEMSPSTGEPLLDKASIDAFTHWKFIPGTVTKVRIPIRYTGNYTKPPKT